MFLRCKKRRKDGKVHHYWSIVGNRRVMDGRILQRHVPYLGELNGVQEASWRRTVELFSSDGGTPQQVSLFPAEHLPGEGDNGQVPAIGIRLSLMRQHDPPVSYLVGTPKGMLNKLENPLLGQPSHTARPNVQVKLQPAN